MGAAVAEALPDGYGLGGSGGTGVPGCGVDEYDLYPGGRRVLVPTIVGVVLGVLGVLDGDG